MAKVTNVIALQFQQQRDFASTYLSSSLVTIQISPVRRRHLAIILAGSDYTYVQMY